jgi:hypothetical protein
MMSNFFKSLQADISTYRERLFKNNIVCDKTNQMFLDLNLNILDFLAQEEGEKLDEWYDYNIETMGGEFTKIIKGGSTNETSQGTLLMFFLRLAQEMKVKYGTIYNSDLEKLYTIMTSKGYKYPLYINSQKDFALDRMREIIERRESLK